MPTGKAKGQQQHLSMCAGLSEPEVPCGGRVPASLGCCCAVQGKLGCAAAT